MKLFPRLINRSVLAVPFLFSTLSVVDGQQAGHSLGSQESAAVVLAPIRLIANLTAVVAGSEVKGGISFGHAGDVVEVSGRLHGLDPNKRYRLCVTLLEKNQLEAVSNRTVEEDAQNLVTPREADSDGNLGVLLADASGGIQIKTALKGVGLAEGKRSVLGKTLILTEIPADGDAGAPVQVASATVEVPESSLKPVQPSRLDDIEPDERWF